MHLDPVWVFALIFQWWFRYWQFILKRQSFLLLLRFCRTSFFLIWLSLFFAWTVSFGITVSGMPQFCKSPSLVLIFLGFSFIIFFLIMTASLYWLFGTITVFRFVRTSLVPFVMHLGQLRELPCPRLWLRVLIFEKKISYFFGSKGLTRDYHPYNSSL